VQTEPIRIDGIAGPIVVTRNAFLGRTAVTVDGVPAPKTGKRLYALPARAGGVVEAYVPRTFVDPYPTLEIDGVPHRTGPTVPVVLRVLTGLPIVLVAVGGALGGLLAALGIVANLAVARTRLPPVVKALVMVGVGVVAYVVWYAIAMAVRGAASSS
jgi:hypothetical protein